MAATSPIARARRSTELSLVVMAGLITACAYTLASLGEFAVIPARIIPFLAVLLGLLVLAHLAVRWLAAGADGTLLPLAALLHGIGYVMITRLDDRLAGLQTTWSIVAIAGFVATLVVVQRAPDLARYRWSFLLVGVVLLLLPLVPGLGFGVGGARIWVSLGPINFQPGEFAKLLLAIFFAGYLAENRELIAVSTWRLGPLRLPEPRHLLPILLAWGFTVVVMVGQRDLGSSLLFFALFVVMMWVATERVSYLLIGLVLFAGAAYVAWRMFGHVQTRVSIWLDPWSDSLDSGYQIVQALYGLSDGGIGGTGLGLGSPNTVPEAQNDFIFTSIGEELGLLGAAAVLMAYLLIIGGGLRTRAAHGQHVREAARRRPHHDRGRPGLHHRGRRHQARPADRHHAAVRELRRLVAAVELHPPRPAHPAQRLRARRLHELPDDPTPAERWAAWRLRRRRATIRSPLMSRVANSERASASERRTERPAWPGNAMNRQIRQLASGPDGLLRGAVRHVELLAGRPQGGARRLVRQHPRHPPRVRAAPRPDHRQRRHGHGAVRGDGAGQRRSRTSGSTRSATCSPTSPGTTRSRSGRPVSSARRTTCWRARRPSSSCGRSRASSTATGTTRARSSRRCAGTSNRPPRTPSVSARVRSW